MPTAGDTPGRHELSADGSRAEVDFHPASAAEATGPDAAASETQGAPGELQAHLPVVAHLKLKLPAGAR